MTPREDPALSALLETFVVAAGAAPGATVGLATRRAGAWRLTTGAAGNLSSLFAAPTRCDTPYDLASITKSVTAVTCARLAAKGRVSLDTRLGELLAEARDTPSQGASLEALLSHRAGLEAHCEFFAPLRQEQSFDASVALRAAANARRNDCVGALPALGFPPLYSDLGYLLVGVALSRVSGVAFDELVRAELADPLGIELYSARQWKQHADFLARVAPTEVVPWRGGELRGVVHDENAWAFAGEGCAGNAGLFADASTVARFGVALLDVLAGRARDFLAPEWLARLLEPRPGGTLLAGFDAKAAEGSSAGQWFGPRSFGHLGFTGTSLWCDPDAQLVAAVLTNRVNPTRDNQRHRQCRPLLADALFRHAADRGAR